MILITGATGRTGSQAAKLLAQKGEKVRALVRNPEKAAALQAAGVEIAVGDAGDAASVRAALKGVDRIAIILPNGEKQLEYEKQLASLAAEAGVKHILKVSSMESHANAPNPTHAAHWDSELHIKSLGVPWTMVRPSFYMQNFLSNAATIKAENKFYYPFGEDGGAVMMDARDVGYFIAHVFTTPGHGNKSYDITSGDRLKMREAAEVISRVLGRKVEYVPQDPAAFRAHLGRFIKSQWHLDAVCDIFREIANGYMTHTTTTFKDVTGRDPVSLEGFIRDHAAVFKA
ncbi:MAG: SDR family oxidoreductase [Steroidobacteraceae bacterium]|jgi:uncharacterized protein YbjT (DUF2867 family)